MNKSHPYPQEHGRKVMNVAIGLVLSTVLVHWALQPEPHLYAGTRGAFMPTFSAGMAAIAVLWTVIKTFVLAWPPQDAVYDEPHL